MPIVDVDQAEELETVELARAGDHDAFVILYRTHAPLAWRLALALTADGDLAADAVAEAFARSLAPLRPGAIRSATPFRVRLLASTRHAVLDARAVAPAYVAPAPAPDPRPQPHVGVPVDDAELARRRAIDVLAAFHQLPERWRTALWLPVVEGLDPVEAGGIVGVDPADARELFVRAAAGLRSQWVRDRVAAGEDDPVAPDQLHLHLQSTQPLPLELYLASEDRWSAQRRPTTGALALVLPGGRPLPRWAERTLLVSSAALIAAGITAAIAVDRDPAVRDVRNGILASPAPTTTAPAEPKAYLDEDDTPDGADTAAPTSTTTTPTARRETRIVVVAISSGEPTTATTAAPGLLAKRESDAAPPTTSTTAPPVLQVTAGLGPLLGVALGDGCTGVELVGQTIGCPPATRDDGLTLDVGGTLLGGG